MHFFELGATVRVARREQGMTQAQLATLSDLSRVTINQIENGAAPDIGMKKMMKIMNIVGLTLTSAVRPTRPAHDFLAMACTSANVSFRKRMAPDDLAAVFITGKVAAGFRPHLRVVLDELPKSVLEGAMRQAAKTKDFAVIKSNLAKVAGQIGSVLKVA